MLRRTLLASAMAAPMTTLGAAPGAALAQPAWPTRSLRFVVPFAPGGPVEPPARLIAEHLSQRLGQPVVVELKPGAAGAIGARDIAHSTDGHSFLFMTNGLPIIPALQKDPGYDLFRDLKPITLIADMPMCLVVKADSPVRDVADMFARARARPGRISYGSSGVGSITHLAWLLLENRTGTEFLHVPYRGAGQAVNAVYTGEIEVYIGDLGLLLPHVREGRMRLLAVTSAHRLPLAPDVPALAESVPGGYSLPIYYCLVGPAATPDAVVQRLIAEIEPMRNGGLLAQRIAAAGGELLLNGPAPLAERLRVETPLWREVLGKAGISPE
jgi:tripartite-type tricarboxylate transporter receptor subunit TctC